MAIFIWLFVGLMLLMVPAFFIGVVYISVKLGIVHYLGIAVIVFMAFIFGFLFCEGATQ